MYKNGKILWVTEALQAEATTKRPMRVVFALPWLPSKVTTILCTFFARIVSVGLTLGYQHET